MIRISVLVVALFGAFLLIDAADQLPRPQKGSVSPTFGVLAHAVDENGQVAVHFYFPMRAHQHVEIEGKGEGTLLEPPPPDDSFSIARIVDGGSLRAFGADGQVLEPKLLLKRLAKRSRVVLFQGTDTPDPYYIGLFNKDTILFVGPEEKFLGMGAETTLPLSADALHAWLGIISDPHYQLIFASSQGGYFFAFWQDRDGDLLFSHYDTRNLKVRSMGTRLIVQDSATGEVLESANLPKEGPPEVKINNKSTHIVRGLNSTSRSVSLSPGFLSRGTLFIFKNHKIRSIRVMFKETIDDGEEQVVLNQVLTLPPTGAHLK